MFSDEGYDAFFRDDFPRLVAFLCKAGFEVRAARDVAAETMLRAFEAWPTLDEPRAWVRRTASGSLAGPEPVRHDWAPHGDEDDEKLTALAGPGTPLLDLFARLPGRQRMVLAWSLDGFAPAEIAGALRVRPATVRSTLRHVRERLKRLLPDEMSQDEGR